EVAFFSSSSRSMRSTKALSWSLAKRVCACSGFSAAAAVAGDIELSWWSWRYAAISCQGAFGIPRPQVKESGASSTLFTALVAGTGLFERRLLFFRGFLLVFRLPLIERLAVDDLAALILRHRDALGVGGVFHPVRETIAAEASQIHHVDVLHVGATAQMLNQTPVDSRLELGAGFVVQGFIVHARFSVGT